MFRSMAERNDLYNLRYAKFKRTTFFNSFGTSISELNDYCFDDYGFDDYGFDENLLKLDNLKHVCRRFLLSIGRLAAWFALGIMIDIFMIYKVSYIYPVEFYLSLILLSIALAVILYFTWPAVVGALGIGFIGVMMSPTVNFAAATTLCCLTYFFGSLFSLSVVGNLVPGKSKKFMNLNNESLENSDTNYGNNGANEDKEEDDVTYVVSKGVSEDQFVNQDLLDKYMQSPM